MYIDSEIIVTTRWGSHYFFMKLKPDRYDDKMQAGMIITSKCKHSGRAKSHTHTVVSCSVCVLNKKIRGKFHKHHD